MTQATSHHLWQQIAGHLQNAERGLLSDFPDVGRQLSLLDALGHTDVAVTQEHARIGVELRQQLSGLLGQLGIFESISRCPILAITGLLNAGKSSLLAAFLSPENQPRVLRGVDNAAGTHRFVFWLPKIWRNEPELLGTLDSLFTELFGHPPEQLSDDPAQAALQYNGHILPHGFEQPSEVNALALDALSIPLVAFDEKLDALKIGLVDCPDIQTGFLAASGATVGADLATARRQQLSRVGRLCSAFIVVSKMNSLHDEGLSRVLATLREAMPGVPRLLAINKIKSRYAPEVVYDQARDLVNRFDLQSVFGAYDFRSSQVNPQSPPPPRQWPVGGDALPVFFELSTAAESDELAGDKQAVRYLLDLGARLDIGHLSRASCRSLVLRLQSKALEAVEWLEVNQQLGHQLIQDAWQAISAAAYEFMAERDASGHAVGLRLQTSPAIVAQMADSLQRTAPAFMQVSMSIDRSVRQLQQAVSNSAARFKVFQSASQKVMQFAKKYRRGEGAQVVTPQRLADQIRNCDIHDAFREVPEPRLVGGCEHAMQRFAEEDKTVLDERQLDEWSRQVWQSMSWKDKLWKGTQPLTLVLAPLLAAVLVPVDGGSTAVLVFASVKEILAAAGIAAVMAPMVTGGAVSIVQRETPWRQLSDLFASLCDSLGLPRPTADTMPTASCNDVDRKLLVSNLAVKPASSGPAIQQWRPGTSLDELLTLIQEPI